MKKGLKVLFVIGLLAAIGNVFGSIVEDNYYAMIGWLVALCWFPYDEVFAKKGVDEQ